MIASCSEDKTCKIWKHDQKSKEKAWSEYQIKYSENQPLYKVSWSQAGNLLAVTAGDGQVHVMSEENTGDWREVELAKFAQ